MFLVERNGSNPFSLSALENTLFSVQIVFQWKMLVGMEVVEGGRRRFGHGYVSYMQVLGTGAFPFLCTEDAHTVPQVSSIINK